MGWVKKATSLRLGELRHHGYSNKHMVKVMNGGGHGSKKR